MLKIILAAALVAAIAEPTLASGGYTPSRPNGTATNGLELNGRNMQGRSMQGRNMQGISLNGVQSQVPGGVTLLDIELAQ